MANYKESEVTGTQWTRCNLVVISNPLNAAPLVQFQEESVFSAPAGTVVLPVSTDRLTSAVDPNNVIELINPQTGEPLGETVTEGFLYMALFSKYLALAKARDAALEPTPEPTPEPSPEPSPEPTPDPTPEP